MSFSSLRLYRTHTRWTLLLSFSFRFSGALFMHVLTGAAFPFLYLYIFFPPTHRNTMFSLRRFEKKKKRKVFFWKTKRVKNWSEPGRPGPAWKVLEKKKKTKETPADWLLHYTSWYVMRHLAKTAHSFEQFILSGNRRRRGWRADERTCLTLIDSRPSATCRVLPKHRNWEAK